MKILTLIGLQLLFALNFAGAQKAADLLRLYNEKLPVEKIYLHYDKDLYVPGETIWFKAYLMTGLTIDTVSSSIFVELSDPSGKIILKQALPILESTATGNFDLPDSMKSGNYSIRAYTTWMLNFEDEFLYHRNIYIYNSESSFPLPAKPDAYTVNFFPESGNIIADVVNYVGMKATDAFGYPVEFSGSLVDSKGNSITDLKTTHDGMGKFTLLAAEGEIYYADIKFNNGKVAKVQLPAVKNKGLTIHIDEVTTGKRIVISRAEASGKTDLILVGQIGNNVVIEKEVTLEKESVLLSLPTRELPSGILQLTLLDKDLHPILERLTFVNSDDYSVPSGLTADTFNITRRAKNVFTFTVPDTVEGNYSVAVTDYDKVPVGSDREDIISRFLLSSGLRGYIHNPAYYFSNNDKKTKDALDLVMMTNGWRRINWEQVISKYYPEPAYKPLPYISISGKAFAENGKDPVTSGDLNFIYKVKGDSTINYTSAAIDNEGHFILDPMIFSDTAAMIYNLNIKKKSKRNVRVVLDRKTIWPSNPYLPTTHFSENEVPDSLKQKMKRIQDDLKNYSAFIAKAVMLKEIKITGRKKNPTQAVVDRYSSGPFNSNSSRVMDLVTNPVPYGMSLITFLRANFPRIIISGGAGNYQVQSSMVTSIMGPRQAVTVYFDEIETDINFIDNLPMDEIALVKYESQFVLSPANGPALMIYQKKPEDMKGAYSSVLPKFYFPGYHVTREFYSPNYSMPDERHSAPDVRTTLFWDPNILLDKSQQQQKISFYNSDNCKKIRIILEGVTADGRLCRIEKVY